MGEQYRSLSSLCRFLHFPVITRKMRKTCINP
jgi:hypothetical protein